MNLDRIRERLADGFKPFALELSSGRRVRALHRDFVALGRGGVVVLGSGDSVMTVDAPRIRAIEELRAPKRRK